MASKSNRSAKPKKPYSDFPLGPANNGRWQKKINGKLHYFGPWGRVVDGKMTRIEGDAGWRNALAIYQTQKDDLYAGRRPRSLDQFNDDLTVAGLCNHFRTAKKEKLDAGRITAGSYAEYVQTCDRLVRVFGGGRSVEDLRPADFNQLLVDIGRTWGLIRLGNEVTRVKSVFKFARENGLTAKPVTFGSEFKKPDEKELRRHRAKNGKHMLEADELRRLIDAASVPLRAMLLLGVNCGFGNHDVATLRFVTEGEEHRLILDLEEGWVDYPRPKTGIERRSPLWPETVNALRAAIDDRPHPREEAEPFVFVTSRGRQWLTCGKAFPVVVATTTLMKSVGVHRKGIGFYTLRHVFRTVADGTKDPVAIDRIMGHADHTMGGRYRERIDDSRLVAVAQHVHDWLFPRAVEGPTDKQHRPKQQLRPKGGPVEQGDSAGAALRLFIA